MVRPDPVSARFSSPARRAGFTLVELLVAVSLLVMIVLTASYIFDTTIKAVGHAQGSNELSLQLESFSRLFRDDARNIEPDGMLKLGAREQTGFGSPRERANGYKRNFRIDWMSCYVNGEQYGSIDTRLIGTWSKVFWGHGVVTNPSDNDYTSLATDWVLLRHQILMMPSMLVSRSSLEQMPGNPYASYGPLEGVEFPGQGDYVGAERMYGSDIYAYTARQFRWFWMMNYGWSGSVSMPWAFKRSSSEEPRGIYEPNYFQSVSVYYGWNSRRFHALAHCGEFRLQYAMPEDVTDGLVVWRDPPKVGQSGYEDPNYRSYTSDALHSTANVPTSGDNSGMLSFGPGDRWPALLKLSVHVFDPLDRFDGGKSMSYVVPVP